MPHVNCKICDSSFYTKPRHLKIGWGKYCSQKCQYQAQRTGSLMPCHICSKQIWRTRKEISDSEHKNFFCSKSCQTIWRNKKYAGNKHASWINGIATYRKTIKESGQREICTHCGITNTRVLIVHHIDITGLITILVT